MRFWTKGLRRGLMSALAIGTMLVFFGATTADAQRGFRGGGGGFRGAAFHGGGGFRGGGFAGPRFGAGPRFVGGPRFGGGPRFYGGGPRVYRGGFYGAGFRPGYAPGFRRAYWGGRPGWRWRRPWIAPVVIGTGFYGAGWYGSGYYGSCWRWRFTPWGWRQVNVCGWGGGPYWGAAAPWGW